MKANVRARFLWVLKHSLNRLTTRAARAGVGPFSLVRHVGRKSGRQYETPVILASAGDDFVCELTYGERVDWYRNVLAAGNCVVIYKRNEYRIDRISQCATADGMRAFGPFKSRVLRVLRRKDFRLLHVQSPHSTPNPS